MVNNNVVAQTMVAQTMVAQTMVVQTMAVTLFNILTLGQMLKQPMQIPLLHSSMPMQIPLHLSSNMIHGVDGTTGTRVHNTPMGRVGNVQGA